ncbi:MAG TPA: hypothetical protein VLW50_24315 [Streptosporangiaceae bacterium]|nr:hypothetical protein [Streptosporangiaceae bacterium]
MDLRLRGRVLPDKPAIMANIGWPDVGPDDASLPRAADRTAQGPSVTAAARGAALAAVRSAVTGGARLIDLGAASSEAVGAVRAIDPGVIVCADAPGADVTRDPCIAQRTGATLLRPGPAAGPSGAGGGREPVLITGTPADVGRLSAAGWAVLVDVDTGELAGTLAVAAVCTWLGARIVRTKHIAAVRQAVEMVESIRGTRAPSWTRRGLA